MKSRTALMASFACAIAAAASTPAPAAIPPSALVAGPADMPGFTTAAVRLRSATSPSRYAKVVLGERGREMSSEAARLKRSGFREGVQELLSTPHGEALSFALVLGSARIARQELRSSEREALRAQGRAAIDRFTVPAIRGAFAFSAVEVGQSFAAANVLFATGRCFLLVGDLLGDATREEATAAPVSAASALYEHVKGPCAGRLAHG